MPVAVPVVSVEPTLEPITLAEAKKQLEISADDTNHDKYLSDLITSAREQVEHDTGIVALTATIVEKRDAWPCEDYYELSLRPAQSVTSIAYIDENGDSQTWAASNYEVDTGRVRPTVWLAHNVTWPLTRSIQNAITTTYVAGSTNRTTISEQIRNAIKVRVAQEFADREGKGKRYEGAYDAIVTGLMRSSYP